MCLYTWTLNLTLLWTYILLQNQQQNELRKKRNQRTSERERVSVSVSSFSLRKICTFVYIHNIQFFIWMKCLLVASLETWEVFLTFPLFLLKREKGLLGRNYGFTVLNRVVEVAVAFFFRWLIPFSLTWLGYMCIKERKRENYDLLHQFFSLNFHTCRRFPLFFSSFFHLSSRSDFQFSLLVPMRFHFNYNFRLYACSVNQKKISRSADDFFSMLSNIYRSIHNI